VIQVLFLVIATLGVLAALGVVLARNLVHAALYLVAFFFLAACQFVILEAEFMAAIQVLIYIGAVSILLMFGIMLTRNIQGDDTTIVRGSRLIPPGLVSLALIALLCYGAADQVGARGLPTWSSIRARPALGTGVASDPPTARAAAVNEMGRVVGVEMLTRYVIAFEVAGLLLTAALVGAIALARSGDEETPREGAIAAVEPGTTAGPGAGGKGDGRATRAGTASKSEALTSQARVGARS